MEDIPVDSRTSQPRRVVSLAGEPLNHPPHVCAFFRTTDEEYDLLVPFIREGVELGERAFHVVDPAQRANHFGRLEHAGIDVATAEHSGQLEVRAWDDAYLRGGRFSAEAMLALIQEVLDTGLTRGFPLTRLVAHMGWALEERPGVDELVEYETRLNYVLPNYNDPVICAYDLARFGSGVVIDILRTHPLAIVGGIVQHNPFYVPPDQFLRELRDRPRQPALT